MPFNEAEKVQYLLDLYWKMYSEHATQGRQNETLRGTISTILVSVAAAIIAFQGNLLKPGSGTSHTNEMIAVGIALAVLGVLGTLLSYKHYERTRHHTEILSKFRHAVDDMLVRQGVKQNETLTKILHRGRKAHERKYPISSKWLRAYFLWGSIFFLIAAAGVVITLHELGFLTISGSDDKWHWVLLLGQGASVFFLIAAAGVVITLHELRFLTKGAHGE